MKRSRFILIFVFLMLVQILLAKYVQFAPVLYFCILPALIMSIPTAREGYFVMVVAFVCGITIDILADGCLGLNAASAVLCAAFQRQALYFFVDSDVVDRHYAISFKRYGSIRIMSALAGLTFIYLLMYSFADGVGFLSMGHILGKALLSTLASLPLGAIVVSTLCPYQR